LKLVLLTTPILTYFAGYKAPKDSPHKSFSEFSKGAMLNWERLKYFASNMFGTEEEKKRIVEEIEWFWLEPLGAESFAGLCDTFIATAECDPVRDEGALYGMKAIAAGVAVTVKR
jgi:acetyl esterase/lipase